MSHLICKADFLMSLRKIDSLLCWLASLFRKCDVTKGTGITLGLETLCQEFIPPPIPCVVFPKHVGGTTKHHFSQGTKATHFFRRLQTEG